MKRIAAVGLFYFWVVSCNVVSCNTGTQMSMTAKLSDGTVACGRTVYGS